MSLKSEAAKRGVLCGAGMRNWTVFTGTSGLQAKTEAEFNVLMPGNAFKWVNTEPTQGVFDFTEADLFIAWADARSMYTRCHTLVWHTSLAAWVSGAVNSGTWQGIIDAHIDGVLSHYPGRIWDIDVVNEAFREEDAQPGGFRNSLWYQAASGSDYVPYAFERARVHAPSGRLHLAEFGIEQADGDERRANMLTAIQDWLSQGIPIDGVAIQGHIHVDVALDKVELRRFIRDLKGMGLDVLISEFDFRDIANLSLSDADAFAFCGAYGRDFLRTALDAGAQTVIAWGVAPEDWSGTSTEQIAAVPFAASPDFESTAIANGMIAAFQPNAIAAQSKELVTVVEIDFLPAA